MSRSHCCQSPSTYRPKPKKLPAAQTTLFVQLLSHHFIIYFTTCNSKIIIHVYVLSSSTVYCPASLHLPRSNHATRAVSTANLPVVACSGDRVQLLKCR